MVPSSITILHITDLHVGSSLGDNIWTWTSEAFEKDLRAQCEAVGEVDLVCFSGDAAQSGRIEEYVALESFVTRLSTNFPSAPWLIVPGNHDLERPSPGSNAMNAAESLELYSSDPNARDRLWGKGSEGRRSAIAPCFDNYLAWSKKSQKNTLEIVATRSGLLPGDQIWTFEKNGLRLGILGLNTSFLQLSEGSYKERLAFDQAQLEAAGVGPDWFTDHDHTILLTHHSRNWLTPADRKVFDDIIGNRISLHLCGHEHAQDFTMSTKGSSYPRRTFVGRSLCGIEKYNNTVDRAHGYAIINISRASAGDELTVFPREASRREEGGWGFHPLRSVECDRDGKMLFAGNASVPLERRQKRAPSPLAASKLIDKQDPIGSASKWLRLPLVIPSSFIPDIELFFDGGQPSWPLISKPQVPVREIVDLAFQQLSHLSSTMIQLVAPAGEGKSTALRQLALKASAAKWNVYFLEDSTEFSSEGLPSAEIDEPVLFVVDEAHVCVQSLFSSARTLQAQGRIVSWAVAARTAEWLAAVSTATAEMPEIEQFVRVWPERHSRNTSMKLTPNDANSIVEAWESAGSLRALETIPKADRARTLLDASKRPYGTGGASFLGAILQVRFSPSALRSHIKQAMMRMASIRVGDAGGNLFEAIFLACAAEVAGIDGVDLAVVASYVAVPLTQQRIVILNRLGEEAIATGGNVLRSRHPAIALATIQMAEGGELPGDLEFALEALARTTAELGRDGLVRENHSQTLHSSPRMLSTLRDAGVEAERSKSITARFAETAADVLSDVVVVTTTLSAAFRSCGRAKDAHRRLLRHLSHFQRQPEWKYEGRGYLLEIGITAGFQGDWSTNLTWALQALADNADLVLRRSSSAVVLVAIGECSLKLTSSKDPLTDLIGAIAYLLERVAMEPRHTFDAAEFRNIAARDGKTVGRTEAAIKVLEQRGVGRDPLATDEAMRFTMLEERVEGRRPWAKE